MRGRKRTLRCRVCGHTWVTAPLTDLELEHILKTHPVNPCGCMPYGSIQSLVDECEESGVIFLDMARLNPYLTE